MRQGKFNFVPKGVDTQFTVITGIDAAEFFGPVGKLGMDGWGALEQTFELEDIWRFIAVVQYQSILSFMNLLQI